MGRRSRLKRLRCDCVALMGPNAPEYSEATLAKIAALRDQSGPGGPYPVAVYHEQFCADALRAGARRCLCSPEVKILRPDGDERDRRALREHWLTRELHGGGG